MRRLSIILVVLVCIMFVSTKAEAILIWNWSFVDSIEYVDQFETINLDAVIENDISSSENFDFSNLIGTDVSSPFIAPNIPEYADYVSWHSLGFGDQFQGSIAPGESRVFTFGNIVPRSAGFPEGIAQGSGTLFLSNGIPGSEGTPFEQFYTVVVDSNAAAVPEPTTLALFGAGLAGMMLKRRKKI